METTFTVIDAADEYTLLTVAERRAAAGLDASDTSRDADLEALDLAVASAICAECNIPEADESAHRGFALCLTQERQFQRQASIRGGEA